ncbi:hypothetical protein GGTG_09348 [Gaeumannomyces tritici R3-111a-1]|uniref:Uncharacterized protein n=1 Tax=Gaeumannomyces tritici (strain R3-111a-1) TaxID=644352 RepID=J3P751_GAET3|nr:hypothetical protein GGTG_09348 [Gaeumannomyces tritici R3-111a-1]EJT72482.1 hypothetical protein GGTG_09348 [Gaeumannomyces tritici R3-111a-1]
MWRKRKSDWRCTKRLSSTTLGPPVLPCVETNNHSSRANMALRLDEAAFVSQRLVEISHRGRRYFGAPEGTQFETDPPAAFVLMTTCIIKMHRAHHFRPTRGIDDRQMKLRKVLDFFRLLQLLDPGHRQRQQRAQFGAVLRSVHRGLASYMTHPLADDETVRILEDMERGLVCQVPRRTELLHLLYDNGRRSDYYRNLL